MHTYKGASVVKPNANYPFQQINSPVTQNRFYLSFLECSGKNFLLFACFFFYFSFPIIMKLPNDHKGQHPTMRLRV